jgi:integrase
VARPPAEPATSAAVILALAKQLAQNPQLIASLANAVDLSRGEGDDEASFSDNPIALDGGSSAPKEEPMYFKIYGPYYKNGHYHVHLHLLDGTRKYKSFATEEAAMEFVHRNEARIVAKPITVAEAIREYGESRVELRPSSRATIQYRLEALASGFEEVLIQAFPAVTAWNGLVSKNAVDTLHGIRSAAKGFFEWCVGQSYLKKNPLAGIKIVGKKKRGKPQLRLDEARAFLERALTVSNGEKISERQSSQQEVGVLGAATALLLGLRNGEVVGCQVRDLDDGGCTLWIAASKTPAGLRRVEVPDVLRPHLLKLAENRGGTESLFPSLTKEGMRYWTKALCKEMGLPIVTPQGLRGTHATASMRPHANPHEVAAALGHTSFRVTERHYAQPEAVAAAKQQAASETLLASKNPSKTPSKTVGHVPKAA